MFSMEQLRDQRVSMKPQCDYEIRSLLWWDYRIKHVQKERYSPSFILRSSYKELKIYSSEHLKINVLNICQKICKTAFFNQTCFSWIHHQDTALFFSQNSLHFLENLLCIFVIILYEFNLSDLKWCLVKDQICQFLPRWATMLAQRQPGSPCDTFTITASILRELLHHQQQQHLTAPSCGDHYWLRGIYWRKLPVKL